VRRGEGVLVVDLAAGCLLAFELVAVEVGTPSSAWATAMTSMDTVVKVTRMATIPSCLVRIRAFMVSAFL
jgi:hypothetical protein